VKDASAAIAKLKTDSAPIAADLAKLKTDLDQLAADIKAQKASTTTV